MVDFTHNWAGNIAYGARAVHEPRTVDELQSIVRAADMLRAIGTRHCFNDIAATGGDLVSLRHLNAVTLIDSDAHTVTVEGGATYRDIGPALHEAGFALRNLASLPHITIAGACATGTHGSGSANPGLAASVAGLSLVTADGELRTYRRGDPQFDGLPVHLGALGIVASLTLDLVPRFDARQEVWLDLSLAAFAENFETIMASAYSVSAFTDWRSGTINQLWRKSLGDATPLPRELFGARWSERPVHLVVTPDAPEPTGMLGINEPAYRRLPHYGHDDEIPPGAELQTEYFLARADAPAALAALHAIRDRFVPLLLISEIRTVAADDLWLSGSYQRDSVALHFAFRPDWAALQPVLPEIEAALAPFAPRPHWGKLFTLSRPVLDAAFPRLPDFRALAHQLDPTSKFRNPFLERHVL